MQIRYTGQNVEITQPIKEYTEKKLQKLNHHMNKITDIHISFNIEKLNQIVEGSVIVPGTHIHARGSSEDMYESIDKMADKLIRQFIKYKETSSERS